MDVFGVGVMSCMLAQKGCMYLAIFLRVPMISQRGNKELYISEYVRLIIRSCRY